MKKYKKYIPVSVILTILISFLFGQIVFDLGKSNALISKEDKKISKHYESIYKKLKLKTYDGKEINLSSEKAPLVIFNFWASWCLPCLEEFPSLVKLVKKYPKTKVKVIGINTDIEKQKSAIAKSIKKHFLNFSIVADKDGKITNDFMIEAIPVSIIFHNGKVIEISRGKKDFYSEEVFEIFNKLLKNSYSIKN